MQTVTLYLGGNTLSLLLTPMQIADLKNAVAVQGWYYATDGNGVEVQLLGGAVQGFTVA